MYRIIATDGTEIGYTEKLNYITVSNSGCFIEATKDNAKGIAYKGVAYSLLGEDINKDNVAVLIQEFDSADKQKVLQADIDYLAVMTGVELV